MFKIVRWWPMQAGVSDSGGRTTVYDSLALVGDECGEEGGPDL